MQQSHEPIGRGIGLQVYAAVAELAGEKSGLSVVDKAQQAISATKIAIALNSIAAALKVCTLMPMLCACFWRSSDVALR